MAEVRRDCGTMAVFDQEQAEYVADAMTLDPMEEVGGTWVPVECGEHWHVVEDGDA